MSSIFSRLSGFLATVEWWHWCEMVVFRMPYWYKIWLICLKGSNAFLLRIRLFTSAVLQMVITRATTVTQFDFVWHVLSRLGIVGYGLLINSHSNLWLSPVIPVWWIVLLTLLPGILNWQIWSEVHQACLYCYF